jgi:hypothetical protein
MESSSRYFFPMARLGVLGMAIALLAFVGCGSSGLSESEIKDALAKAPLTYRYKTEQYSGDGSAVGGAATNGRATVKFEVVSGQPTVEDPVFRQDKDDIDRFQRSVGNGYTVTFNLPKTREASRRQAPVANAIEGAMCERVNDCGGPAG